MNKVRRRAIAQIKEELETLKERMQDILDDEENCRDSIPENLQNSARYEEAEAACDSLADALAALEEAIDSMEEVEARC